MKLYKSFLLFALLSGCAAVNVDNKGDNNTTNTDISVKSDPNILNNNCVDVKGTDTSGDESKCEDTIN